MTASVIHGECPQPPVNYDAAQARRSQWAQLSKLDYSPHRSRQVAVVASESFAFCADNSYLHFYVNCESFTRVSIQFIAKSLTAGKQVSSELNEMS